jgi:hypothetical protein
MAQIARYTVVSHGQTLVTLNKAGFRAVASFGSDNHKRVAESGGA